MTMIYKWGNFHSQMKFAEGGNSLVNQQKMKKYMRPLHVFRFDPSAVGSQHINSYRTMPPDLQLGRPNHLSRAGTGDPLKHLPLGPSLPRAAAQRFGSCAQVPSWDWHWTSCSLGHHSRKKREVEAFMKGTLEKGSTPKNDAAVMIASAHGRQCPPRQNRIPNQTLGCMSIQGHLHMKTAYLQHQQFGKLHVCVFRSNSATLHIELAPAFRWTPC